MVSLGNATVALLVLGVFGVSLMNSGGGMVAVVVAAVVLGLYLAVPFVQQYVLSVNKGKAARKTPSKPENGGGRE